VGVIKNSNNNGNIRGEKTGRRNGKNRNIIIKRTRIIKRNIYLIKYK
jgi:hypothetical protein